MSDGYLIFEMIILIVLHDNFKVLVKICGISSQK